MQGDVKLKMLQHSKHDRALPHGIGLCRIVLDYIYTIYFYYYYFIIYYDWLRAAIFKVSLPQLFYFTSFCFWGTTLPQTTVLFISYLDSMDKPIHQECVLGECLA